MSYFVEVGGPPARIVFRYANRVYSAVGLVGGILVTVFGWWMYTWVRDPVAPYNPPRPAFGKDAYIVPIAFGLGGLFMCAKALVSIWSYQHLELDRVSLILTRVTKSPWKTSCQRIPFTDIKSFLTTEIVTKDENQQEQHSYRVDMLIKDDVRICLGSGIESNWYRLGSRLAELTGKEAQSKLEKG